MFAFFALAGDLGCSGGPTLVGLISELASASLKTGIMCAVVFPALLVLGVLMIRKIHPAENG